MKAYDLFKEYIWLVQTLHRNKKLSLKELNKLWKQTDMSGGLNYSRSTFNRHKDAIQMIFGIYIECDISDHCRYYIGNSHVLDEDSVQNWLISTLSVNNIISESLSIQERIQIEAISDDRFLTEIIGAMKKNRMVEIVYRKFGAGESKILTFAPYALKVYQHRWYVLGKFPEYFGVFSFDRIEKVTIQKEKFKFDKNFNLKDYYRDCYGIVHAEKIETQRIVIRAYGVEAYNMRTLPLHHSQRELEKGSSGFNGSSGSNEEYADFELYLKPTLDFSGRILSRSALLEVMEPQWLREDIMRMHLESLNRYLKV